MIKELHRMAIFVNVVEQGSFSKAAAHLGLGKSIISAHVSALEARVGTKLINRSTRALALTTEGTAFYQHCRQMVSAAESAFATVESHGSQAGGIIRMTSSFNFGVSFLIPQLAIYRQLHPDVVLDLVLEDSVSSMIEERFDLALRVGRLADTGLFATELGRCRLLLCASPTFISAHPNLSNPSEIVDLPWISITQLPHPEHLTLVHVRSGEHVNVRVRASIKTHSGIGAREFVRCGAGVGLLPDFAVTEDIKRGDIIEILPDWQDANDRPISVVFPSRDLLPTRVRLLIDFLRQAYANRMNVASATSRRKTPPSIRKS
jgi:DNA-binding transcriptional LysR family regulator